MRFIYFAACWHKHVTEYLVASALVSHEVFVLDNRVSALSLFLSEGRANYVLFGSARENRFAHGCTSICMRDKTRVETERKDEREKTNAEKKHKFFNII